MAQRLVAAHRERAWIATYEHKPGDGCLFCDVLRRASELALS